MSHNIIETVLKDYHSSKIKVKSSFNGRIFIIGYGGVAKCTLPLLLDNLKFNPKKMFIVDMIDKSQELKDFIKKGITYKHLKITKENYQQVFSEHCSKNDLIIDLAFNIGTSDFLVWCSENEVMYINTSIEKWDPYKSKDIYEKTLYSRHMQIRDLNISKNATTMILDHGANPGLISHFVKQGLIDIGNKLISESKSSEEIELISEYIKTQQFNKLSMALGVKVIHCSERDTQIVNDPKKVDEFVGTWSNEGLHEEGMSPSEIGWGTHEDEIPEFAIKPHIGPKNQIFLPQMGINTWVKSWVPNYDIIGMVIRHGEAFSISERLTVKEKDKIVYRPTVHYAYLPCDSTITSLHELRCRNYKMPKILRIMNDEIIDGADILGGLIMGHKFKSWWIGSILDIHQARKLLPHQNSTTIQVAIGAVAAIKWMLENRNKGICLPDDLPHDFIIDYAKPYLGKFISIPVNWTPLKNDQVYFKENKDNVIDKTKLWTLKNFLFKY